MNIKSKLSNKKRKSNEKIILIIVLLLAVASPNLASAESDYSAYLVNEYGEGYGVLINGMSTSSSTSGDELSKKTVININSENLVPLNSNYRYGWDPSGSVRAELTVNFGFTSYSGLTHVKVNGVSGGWSSHNSTVQVSNSYLVVGSSGVTSAGGHIDQSRVYYPGSSFTYNPNFSTYVVPNSHGAVGANLNLTLIKGGTTWTLYLQNNYIS